MNNHERFLEPNFLITTHDNAVGRKQRKKRRRNLRGREGVYAKVGLRKDRIERINVDPSTILVPAALPPEIEEQRDPAPYAFSSMLTYSQRKKNALPMMQDGTRLMAQDLYSSTRDTFASTRTKKFGQEEEEEEYEYNPATSTMSGSDSLEELSTLSSFPSFSDTASHGTGIASRAMKNVASGATSSFGRAERFAAEARRRRKIRTDRFYNVDGGTKCTLAKSVSKSLCGTAMAHNQAPRFAIKSAKLKQPDNVGPGSYRTSYGLISTKINDRWDMQSSSFKGVERNAPDGGKRRRRGSSGQHVHHGGHGHVHGLNNKHNQSQSVPILESIVEGGTSPFSKSTRTRAEEIENSKRSIGQRIRQQLKRVNIGGNGSMTVVGQPFQHKTSPTQQLSQTSWNESIPWAGDSTSVVEDGGPKIPVNLIIDVGKTPSVGPELSTTSGIEEGGSVLNEKTMMKKVVPVGGSTVVSPQNSIVSINSINEFMSDKF